MIRRALVLGTALLTVSAANAQMHDHPPLQRRVSVSGEGIVRVLPDMATVRFGVVTVAMDPQEATRLNTQAAADAMNAVRKLGIEERLIRLETLRLQPHREWDEDRRRFEEKGYEAVREVTVELHDLDKLPQLIADVVQKGANRLNQIEYELREKDAARNEALREAVINAREKAQLLASTLGETLGRVEQVNEQSFDFPRPIYRAEMAQAAPAKDDMANPDAFAAGEIEIRVNVHTTFYLE